MSTKQWSELDIIRLFANSTGNKDTNLIKGIGDDCAIIAPSTEKHWLITTDMLVEAVHFNSSSHPPYELGRKCIAVNISDIAAMGGEPKFALLSVSLPDSLGHEWIAEWSRGIDSVLKEFNCQLIGGDTVRGEILTANITIIGDVEGNKAILRATAAAGETIFVSGHLGSAAAGLAVLQNMEELSKKARKLALPFIKQHLNPTPDVTCGKILRQSGMITAMQDISDGLATDLAHICLQSKISALIDETELPCHEDLSEMCKILGCKTTELQISGGEDYKLVFTVEQGRDDELINYVADNGGPPIYHIGKTVPGNGVFLVTDNGNIDITFQGFEHRGSS